MRDERGMKAGNERLRRWAITGLFALGPIVACSDSFLAPWAVTDLRVVAAVVDVDGEPGHANPEPGDGVEVSLRVIDKGSPPSDIEGVPALTPEPLEWLFAACLPLPTLIGAPICADPRAIIQPCEGCVGTPPADPFAFPVMRFQVPSESEVEAAQATSVLLQGIVCVNGVPSTDAIQRFLAGESDDLEPCVPRAEPGREDEPPDGRFVVVQIPIETDASDPNLNPEIDQVRYEGTAWPPPYDQGVPRTAPRTGCRADLESLTPEEQAMHPVAGGPAADIRLQVTRESLQTYTVDDKTLTEEIQITWLTDGGGLVQTFSFITTPAIDSLTQWTPPTGVQEDGQLVRFNFVIRDGRGGTDWVERGLCVLPAPAAESPP